MELEKAVRERRSVRQFKKEQVPEQVIREILEGARWAPSWGNTQPWEFYVITGQPLETVKKTNKQRVMDGVAPAPDISMPQEWPDQMKARYMGIGKSVLTALNIERDDKEGRTRYNADMFYLFDAPCLIVVVQDKGVTSNYRLLDIGLILQTICLLAHDRGLGTCIMACAVGYPDVLRNVAKIPESKTVVMGVAVGYPDLDAPINRFKRTRADVEDFVTWVE